MSVTPRASIAAAQLPDPVAAELVGLVGGQLGQLGDEDLALLTQRAGEQGDRGPLGDVPGHRGPVVDRLVVGMGVHEQQAAVEVTMAHSAGSAPRPGGVPAR